jgi:F-type H+-transporting ATPase subunit a
VIIVEQLPATHLLNKFLAGPANAILNAVHRPAADPTAPIPNYVAMEIVVVVGLLAFFALVRSRLSADNPGGLQHLAESIHEFCSGIGREMIGHHYKPHVPFLAALGMFILCCNLLGLVPGFESPTAVPAVPLGCALCTFVYYQYQGFKHAGFGYIKHFMGPVWWLAPLMFLIEVCSHLARIMSLTIRLFANMFAGDMVTLVFFSLIPLAVPVVFLGLHTFVSLIQTYIFMLLCAVYLGEALAEEH